MMDITTTSPTRPLETGNLPESILQSILASLEGLRFGQVTLIVQDGRVIQIDRTERRRFAHDKGPN